MRKAWIMEEPTGYRSHPHQYRLVSESTLFPGKAQPHYGAFGSRTGAADAARTHGLALTGGPLTLPLVTAADRDQFRLDAQRRVERALNADQGLGSIDGSNVVYLCERAS
ncbi:hypothetical protein BAMBUS_01410 [Brevundimonas phage vB_BpoS-Bambus]|nr:hypothetical protein BAMBUS_01410 [Brevundimonas phage vB_BpoS-Bambus]